MYSNDQYYMKFSTTISKKRETVNLHSYLYQCNMFHDIENNLKALEVPEFTESYIDDIDAIYKKYLPNLSVISYHNTTDQKTLSQITNSFELNELFCEHTSNISVLREMAIEYQRLTSNQERKLMYRYEILPCIENEQNNLEEVLHRLSMKKISNI